MRPFRFLLLASLVLALVSTGCDTLTGDDTSGVVELTGQVLNGATKNPVPNAIVRILPYNTVYEADADGRFTATIEIDSTMYLDVTASKDGFSQDSKRVFARVENTPIQVPTLTLVQTAEETPESGRAANILLLEQSEEVLGVKESGSPEVLNLTFQVADSMGRPVVLDHAVDVNFRLGAAPDGGEYLSPTSVRTDNNGKAIVHLSSGTKAGVVQVVAEAVVEGRTIRSKPVSVTIHGGLPDLAHFTLGPSKYNFHGLTQFNIVEPFSVLVGDKYGNPVKPGTAVYFTSNYSVIEGSTFTDTEGQGAVDFISGRPWPPDGVATVTASTAGENQETLVRQAPVVLSGEPVITLLELGDYPIQLGNTTEFSVTDFNGNPLVGGTTITVTAEGRDVKAVGNTEIEVPATGFRAGSFDDGVYNQEDVLRGPGRTEWSFRAVADSADSILEAVVISVDGPNGRLEIALYGGAGKTGDALPPNVVREVLSDGRIRFYLKEED